MSNKGRRPGTKKVSNVKMPPLDDEETLGALKGMKAVTPSVIATRFNITISVANRMLKQLEDKGIIREVTRSSNLKVYTMIES